VEDDPGVRAALDGMGPATIGMMLGLTVMLARSAIRPGKAAMLDVALLGAALVVGFVSPASPIIVIVAGGVVGALLLGEATPPDTPADE
jgi:chromate transport protein ChrA